MSWKKRLADETPSPARAEIRCRLLGSNDRTSDKSNTPAFIQALGYIMLAISLNNRPFHTPFTPLITPLRRYPFHALAIPADFPLLRPILIAHINQQDRLRGGK